MTVAYKAVGWTQSKRIFDLFMVIVIAFYLAGFVAVGLLGAQSGEPVAPVVLLIRGLATCALILLHVILVIGPMARLTKLFLPLLAHRRHLGVMTFIIAATHVGLAIFWYYGGSGENPILSVLMSEDRLGTISPYRFEYFGLFTLTILFLMAVTSHDFWLSALSPKVWKSLHMLVYVAYASMILHVALGFLQSEFSQTYAIALFSGAGLIISLHLISGIREVRRDAKGIWIGSGQVDWVYAGDLQTLTEGKAKVVTIGSGEKVAIWLSKKSVFATSNLCAHQAGPIGEGRIENGCVTCPWHGFRFDPETGAAVAPFHGQIRTYEVRLEGDNIFLDPNMRPAGRAAQPVMVSA